MSELQTVNPYEDLARLKKVSALSDMASANDIKSAELEHMNEQQWAMLAKAAGTKPASFATRTLVVTAVRNRELNKGRNPFPKY